MSRTSDAVTRYRRHVLDEWDAAALYRELAVLSQGRRRQVLDELASIEDRHAAYWCDKIREQGGAVPDRASWTPSERTVALVERARQHSVELVLPIVEQDERDAVDGYADEPDAPKAMLEDEAGHARTLAALLEGEDGGPALPGPESWHRSDKSGTLRATIFGINDGLVSNTALVMGFAGAGTGRTTVLLAGMAGWLAGAFSMGAGEYISMANQREAFERELELEREEIEHHPEDETRELQLIYEAKGVDPVTARKVAEQVMADKDIALDTMAREELGLDPDDLGSPARAAGGSFLSFSLGAVLIVIPYLFTGGLLALGLSVALAVVALAAVGGLMSRLNGRPVGFGIVRQVGIGALAAAATYAFGAVFGVTTS